MLNSKGQFTHQNVDVRFHSKVDRSNWSGCWIWRGTPNTGGYSQFALTRKHRVGAHRYAYERALGPIPDGMVICHRCDNPRCVRPSHLFAGTYRDNTMDGVAKGRIVPPRVGRPKKFCVRGHDLSIHRRSYKGTGSRKRKFYCRECQGLRRGTAGLALR